MLSPAPRRINNTKYYAILGLAKRASQDELKKASKKPRNEETIRQIPKRRVLSIFLSCFAVCNLCVAKPISLRSWLRPTSDPEKKEIYDHYGDDAMHVKREWVVVKVNLKRQTMKGSMPHQGRLMVGELYINSFKFNVEFRDTGILSVDQCHALETILPPKT